MLLTQNPTDPSSRRRSLPATMTSLINKAKDKLPTAGTLARSSGRPNKSPSPPGGGTDSKSPDRSIPPEPVQQNPHGDFSEHDAQPAMQVHNLARANKRCKKLDWSPKLAREAEEYARTLAEKGKMVHSGVAGQGENLYMKSCDCELEEAVEAWLAEERNYGGEKIGEGELGKWGHFCECCCRLCRVL